MIVDPDFLDHWKTRLLINSLDDAAAPLYVLRLWAHCQNRRTDAFESLSLEALKALCHFPGPANRLEASLVASGFIRRESSLLRVIGWSDYNASLIASWENGKRGGRKKPAPKSRGKPTGIPEGTQSLLSTLISSLPEILKTEEFKTSLSNWIEYKVQRGEEYQPQGLKMMIALCARRAGEHGLPALIAAMERAMANNWQGWDHFDDRPKGKNPSDPRGTQSAIDAFVKGSTSGT